MKRSVVAFFCAFMIVSLASAQARLGDFTMRGAASQVMSTDGFFGAHPSLPFNSLVKITNPRNGREIEVTIIDRIDPSLHRIIDLSSSAIQALGMRPGEQVILTVSAPPRPSAQVSRQSIVDLIDPASSFREDVQTPIPPSVVQAPAPVRAQQPVIQQPAITQQPVRTQPPINSQPAVTISEQIPVVEQVNNVPAPQVLPEAVNGQMARAAEIEQQPRNEMDMASNFARTGDSTEFIAWLMAMSIDARDAREAREAREVREAREAREARELREAREARDSREAREAREARELRESREARELREAREMREAREVRETAAQRQSIQNGESVSRSAAERTFVSEDTRRRVPANQSVDVPAPVSRPAPAAVQPAPARQPAPAAVQPAPARQPAPRQSVAPPVPPPEETEGESESNGSPLVTNINTLVPDLRIASNQSSNIQPRREVQPAPVRPEAVQIIPGLPDRSSGKNYKLQVGAYSAQEAAVRAGEHLRRAGFSVETDYSNSVFRVMVIGVPAADVYSASLRLGALGFSQIWVRE